MRSGFLTASAIAILLTCTPALAQQRTDASKFDIAGVQLGMSFNEAKQAAVTHFTPSSSGIYIDPTKRKNQITGKAEPQYFVMSKGNEKLSVYFTPAPEKSGALVAHQIKYEIPWTQQNEEAMRASALRKYGTQSNHPNGISLDWCIDPSSNLGIGCSMSKGPNLKVSSTNIQLIDPSILDRYQRWLSDQQSIAPSF